MNATAPRWESESDFRDIAYNRKKHRARLPDGTIFVVRTACLFSRRWEVCHYGPRLTATILGTFASLGEAKAAARAAWENPA